MSTALKTLAARLTELRASGSFATRRRASAEDIEITVAGVGKLALPLTQAAAVALCAVARPSPYGLGSATLHDVTVRDSWEIVASRVKIGARRWKPALATHLAAIGSELGIPEGCRLVAEFDKLLIYERGQFFKAHQDSERSDDMVATLVVILPSDYSGGTMSVERRGEKKTFPRARGSSDELSLVAFYADCRHQIAKVTRGVRVALSYRLRIEGQARRGAAAVPEAALEAITQSLRAHFDTRVQPRYGRGEAYAPERFVYLLDHEYSERSLSWNQLKHDDAVRIGALVEAANRLDCERFLTLAEVHESWSCGEDDWSDRRGRRRWDHDDDDDDESDADDAAHELVELIDATVDLTHWIDADGASVGAAKTAADEGEVCFSVASADLTPSRSEHEGYQGNYGNTLDRWYHRAAFVAWPRANSFALMAQASPERAIDQLLAIPTADATKLTALVGSLVPRWKTSLGAAGTSGATTFAKVYRVALRLRDASLVTSWIAPLGVAALTSKPARQDFVALVGRYGAAWARPILEGWTVRGYDLDEKWSSAFPKLCRDLHAAGSAVCSDLASWLLDREVAAAIEESRVTIGRPAPWHDRTHFDRDAARLETLLDLALSIGRGASVERVEQFLLGAAPPVPLWLRVGVLRRSLEGSPELRSRFAGSPLHRSCIDELSKAEQVPARAASDGAIDHALRCSCADCAGLTAFLRSSKLALDWPLAKPRRQHLHSTIEAARLPLSHATLRTGSPQVLQLRKLPSLFARDAEYRRESTATLRALKSLLPATRRR